MKKIPIVLTFLIETTAAGLINNCNFKSQLRITSSTSSKLFSTMEAQKQL